MHTTSKKIRIVGAGITGLTCAYYLLQRDYDDIEIVEKGEYVGGRVQQFQSYPIQSGAFMVFSWYRHFIELTEELGLGSELARFVTTNSYYKTPKTLYKTDDQLKAEYGWRVKFAFIKALAAHWFDSNFNIYAFSDLHRYPTLSALFQDRFGENSLVEEMTNVLLSGYGYASTESLPASFLSVYKESIQHGWIDK
jgi:protoporphyrinogen oxidase